MTLGHTLVVTAALLACAEGSAAQTLSLRVQDGRATLEARGVSARQIVAEWAAQTEATVVGSDALSPEPVTLHLVEVPERVALDIILREARGYILGAGPRRTAASNFGSILIMPATSPRSPASPSESSAAARCGHQPIQCLERYKLASTDPSRSWLIFRKGYGTSNPTNNLSCRVVMPLHPQVPWESLSKARHCHVADILNKQDRQRLTGILGDAIS